MLKNLKVKRNNLWEVDRLVLSDELKCGLIENKKMLDEKRIIQFESVCGDVIQFFENVMYINVPISLFLYIKCTSDLMLFESNL